MLSVPGSTSNYQLDPTNKVIKYAKIYSTAVPSTTLHDGMNTLVLTDGDNDVNDLLLFLTNNTIEVFRNDAENFMSILVTSLLLEPGCTPWYIVGSSIPYNGVVYVKYRGDCGYSAFYYDFNTKTFDDQYIPLQGQGVILSTKDDFDFEAYIENDGQELRMMTMSQEYESHIPANQITDCVVLHDLNPLDPLDEHKLFLTVTCTAEDETTKHYHMEYKYRVSPLNLTVTLLDPGVPVSGAQYIAVRSGKAITVYDTSNLKNGVPGRNNSFSGQILSVVFKSVANQTWLVVQIETSDVYAINASLFVSSRGGNGVYQLTDTNIGHCVPSCLPVISSGEDLIVFSFVGVNSYSCVVFDMSTGMPQEIRRTLNLPERPFAAVFVIDPSFPQGTTQVSTTLGPEVPAANSLTAVALPSIGGVAVIAFIAVLLASVYLGYRIKRKRSSSSSNLSYTVHGHGIELETGAGRHTPTSLDLSQQDDDLSGDPSDPTTPLLPTPSTGNSIPNPIPTSNPLPPNAVPPNTLPPTPVPPNTLPPTSVPSSPCVTVSPMQEVATTLVCQEVTPSGKQETSEGGQKPHTTVMVDLLKK